MDGRIEKAKELLVRFSVEEPTPNRGLTDLQW